MRLVKMGGALLVAATCIGGCSNEGTYEFEASLSNALNGKVGSDLDALKVDAVECGVPGLAGATLRISCPTGIGVKGTRFNGRLLFDFAIKDEKAIGPDAAVDQLAAEIGVVAKPLLEEQKRQNGNQQAWTSLHAREEELRQAARNAQASEK